MRTRRLGDALPSPLQPAVGAGGELAAEVVLTGRALADRDLIVGSLGNVSARVRDGFLITPTRLRYQEMRLEDLVLMSLDGAAIAGSRPPSSEWRMHAAIYRERPGAAAILHTHSVHATAWSFLGAPLEPVLEDCAYYGLGTVRTSPPAPSASAELADCAVSALEGSRAALLGRHGVVAIGASLDEALTTAMVVERQARVSWLLRAV